MIPKTLEETKLFLDKELSIEEKNKLIKSSKDDLSSFHHSLGRYIRNKFELWGNGILFNNLKSIGLIHPDDMSSVIIESYWSYYNNVNFDLKSKIEYYKKHWSKNE